MTSKLQDFSRKDPLAGAPAAPSNVFAHSAAQFHAQPPRSASQPQSYPMPAQLNPSPPRRHQQPSIPAYSQPQDAHAHASLAAHSQAHQAAAVSAGPHEEECLRLYEEAQQWLRNFMESFATRFRHLDERPQSGSVIPGQPASSEAAPAGDDNPDGNGPLHGGPQGHASPRQQQNERTNQQVAAQAPHGADDSQGAPRNRAFPAHRAIVQQSQHQRGQPQGVHFAPSGVPDPARTTPSAHHPGQAQAPPQRGSLS